MFAQHLIKTHNQQAETVTALYMTVPESIPGRMYFFIPPGIGIRSNNKAEPQSVVYTPKCTWVKFKTHP